MIKLRFVQCVMLCLQHIAVYNKMDKIWVCFFNNPCFELLLVIGLCILRQTLQTRSWLTVFPLASIVG